jgi:hypothetical protein
MECQICTEVYNLTTRKKVVCNCEFECCLKCIKTYHQENKKEPNCMGCSKYWTYEFMKTNLGESFIKNVYREIKKEELYKTEMVLMPDTQKRVEMLDKVKIVDSEIHELQRLLSLKRQEREQIYFEYSEHKELDKEKTIENIKCQTNNCIGFLNNEGYCSVCNKTTCKKCLEKKEQEHECNNDILETLKLIKKDSKKCPNCGILIFKIVGCSQMFCTMCKIMFDWNTLTIDNGVGHNPHYIEYMRNNNLLRRDANEIRCGRELDIYLLQDLQQIKKIPNDFYEYIRTLIHLEQVILRKYRPNVYDRNLKYREELIRKEINIGEFKDKIYNTSKNELKNTEIYNLLSTFIRCSTEILYNYKDSNEMTLQETITQIEELKKYINKEFGKFSKVFKIKNYRLTEKNEFVRN